MQISDPLIMAYVLFVACLLGLVMGSFINCWAWRFVQGESVLRGRSHCATCGHDLSARDLVPVLSWLASRGKCRYCGQKVSARYPLSELVCAAAFVAIVAVYGPTLESLELAAFACALLFLSLTDLDSYIIPNVCIIVALAIRALYLAVGFAFGLVDTGAIVYYLVSAFAVGVVLLVLILFADKLFGRESMGGGDLKLFFVAAFYFGWQQSLFLVILSCAIGILAAVVFHPREAPGAGGQGQGRGRGQSQGQGQGQGQGDPAPSAPEPAAASGTTPSESPLKRTIPFGPSIALACLITMVAGQSFVTWYLGFL